MAERNHFRGFLGRQNFAAIPIPPAEPGGEMARFECERAMCGSQVAKINGRTAGHSLPEVNKRSDVARPVVDVFTKNGVQLRIVANASVEPFDKAA